MPVEYEIDTERKIIFVRAYGLLTADEVRAYQASVWEELSAEGYKEFTDAREVTAITISTDIIARLAELAAQLNRNQHGSKMAIVVGSSLHFGLARLYRAYRELSSKDTIGVFRDSDEALTWLLGHDLDD